MITVTLTNEEARALVQMARERLNGEHHGVRIGPRKAFRAQEAVHKIERALLEMPGGEG